MNHRTKRKEGGSAMNRFLPILFGTLVIGSVSTTHVYGAGQPKSTGTPECTGKGIYKPFTTLRKFGLAAAYFVDRELQERARTGTVYPLERIIAKNTPDEIIEKLHGKPASLVVSIDDSYKDSFSSVDSRCTLGFTASVTSTENADGELTVEFFQNLQNSFTSGEAKDAYLLVKEGKIPSFGELLEGKPVIAWNPNLPVDLPQR